MVFTLVRDGVLTRNRMCEFWFSLGFTVHKFKIEWKTLTWSLLRTTTRSEHHDGVKTIKTVRDRVRTRSQNGVGGTMYSVKKNSFQNRLPNETRLIDSGRYVTVYIWEGRP